MVQGLRVGYDGKRAFHNFRGLGNYSRTLIESMQTYFPRNNYLVYTPPFKDKRSLDWIEKWPNIEVKTPKSFLGNAAPSIWRSLYLSNALKYDQLDIFHGLSHELPPKINKVGIKSVVTIHDLIFLRYPKLFPWIDRQVYLKKFTYSCEVADGIVAISEQTKNDLIEYLGIAPSKIEVIYQSCNPIYYTRPSADKILITQQNYELKNPYLLYVGAFEERKNVLMLLNAFNNIAQTYKIDLVLVGSGGAYQERMLEFIKLHNLEKRVRILSNVSSLELPSIYCGAELFIYPALFEGFGIPIIEALFSEVPVITSRDSCFPEAAGEYSNYINPLDLEDLTSNMIKLLDDPDRRFIMKNRGREFVEKFHWMNTSRNMQDYYQKIISQ